MQVKKQYVLLAVKKISKKSERSFLQLREAKIIDEISRKKSQNVRNLVAWDHHSTTTCIHENIETFFVVKKS